MTLCMLACLFLKNSERNAPGLQKLQPILSEVMRVGKMFNT